MNEALVSRGGRVLVLSVDPPETSSKLVKKYHFPFPILSDVEAKVVRQYGVLHPGGSPTGADIAIPSHFLVAPDGKILWQFISKMAQDRLDPGELVKIIEREVPK